MDTIQHEDLVRAGAPELPDGQYYEATEVTLLLHPPTAGVNVAIKERRTGLSKKFLNDRTLSTVTEIKDELMIFLKDRGAVHEDGTVSRSPIVEFLADMATRAYSNRMEALAGRQVSRHLTSGNMTA